MYIQLTANSCGLITRVAVIIRHFGGRKSPARVQRACSMCVTRVQIDRGACARGSDQDNEIVMRKSLRTVIFEGTLAAGEKSTARYLLVGLRFGEISFFVI